MEENDYAVPPCCGFAEECGEPLPAGERGGKLIGEIRLNDRTDRRNIPSCSNGFHDFDNNKLNFSTDVRKGLIWFINQMNQYGEFVPQWEEENKFLWFLNFGMDEKNSDNYREISKKKMKLFSDGAKKIVQKYLD